MSAQISSPAINEAPLEGFREGQEIAFIYNRTDLVSGIITAINPDETFDLMCEIPISSRKINWGSSPGRGDFKVTPQVTLEARPFLRATPIDPRMQVVKTVTTLAALGLEAIDDAARGHKQTSISAWRDSGRRIRIPRLTEFHAPLVGHFFDSSLYYYRITCWRAPINLRGQGIIPEETATFPSNKPYFKSFAKCYKRYVKEYLANLEKWNRVEMQAILPSDILPIEPKGEQS